MTKPKEMNDIESVILTNVEIQANGIIRNSKGRLIGRLINEVEYDSEHVKGLRTTTPKTNGWEEFTLEVLNDLIQEIGHQVTRDYESKGGIWEGMSIDNEKSRQKYSKVLHQAILSAEERGREEERAKVASGIINYIDWFCLRGNPDGDSGIELLNKILNRIKTQLALSLPDQEQLSNSKTE